jgi:vacuolar-type H+-ATPase subunit I/STV1
MDADLIRRVEHVEETVESLRDLPDRTAKLEARMGAVETQIVQLRTEMRDEFSAIRRDMVTKQDFKTELAAIREEMVTKDDLRDELSRFATKDDLSSLRDEFREDIADLGRDFAARLLESEGRTRVLIEDLVARITTGREGSPPAN